MEEIGHSRSHIAGDIRTQATQHRIHIPSKITDGPSVLECSGGIISRRSAPTSNLRLCLSNSSRPGAPAIDSGGGSDREEGEEDGRKLIEKHRRR